MLMDLFIETLTGVSFELHVSPAETIMSVKSKIQKAEGIPVTQQHLIWQNDELDDHRRLRDYSISEGSTLRLVLGLRGGPLNAHRIPPLRLTPIHLTQSTPPLFRSKYGSGCATNGRLAPFSHILPSSMASQLLRAKPTSFPFPTELPHLSSTTNFKNTVADEEKLANRSKEQKTTLLPSKLDPVKPIPKLIFSDKNELQTNSAATSLRNELELPAIVSGSPADVVSTSPKPNINVEQSDVLDRCERISHCDNSEVPPNHPPLGETNVIAPEKSTYQNSETHNSLNVSKCNEYEPSFSLLPTINEDKQTVTLQFSDKSSDYPPLINPGDAAKKFPSHITSHDSPSYWRVCETHDLISPHSFKVANHSTTETTKKSHSESSEEDSDSNFPSKEANVLNNNDINGDSLNSSAATLLAELLARAVPGQTSGTERHHNRQRYPYPWLRKASPLLEESEIQHTYRASELLDTEEPDEDYDALAANMFEADTDREDDDDNDDDDDDVNEDDAVGNRGTYSCALDDDESLADLEDYLFYYRTGDFLFGPPSISTGYPPYSYFAIRDHWSANFDDDFCDPVTIQPNDTESDKVAWRHEYDQLAEKVKNLKTRMKTVRVKRQRRQQRLTSCDHNPNQVDAAQDPQNSEHDKILGEKDNRSNQFSSSMGSNPDPHSHMVTLITGECPQPTSLDSTESTGKNKIRQRRFGTVTPPDVNFLLKTSMNTCHDSLFNRFVSVSSLTLPELVHWEPKTSNNPITDLTSPTSIPDLSKPTQPPVTTESHDSKSNETNSINVSTSARPSTPSPMNPSHCSKSLLSRPVTSTRLSPTHVHTCESKIPDQSRTNTSPQFLPSLTIGTSLGNLTTSVITTRVSSGGEGRVCLPLRQNTTSDNELIISSIKPLENRTVGTSPHPASPPNMNSRSPNGSSCKRKRCALCFRKVGLANSYLCRCGHMYCSRHRYAEVHSCPFDYKAEARRYLIESNPVVTAPKLPKI